jgi:hypothetical protein
MTRKPQADSHTLDDEVIACFIDAHGREVTTITERQEIAIQWCKGNYEHHRLQAIKRRLTPMALLIASLLDIDHPLLVSGRGAVNAVDAAVILSEVMLRKTPVAIPAEVIHKKVVERMEQP